MVTVDTLRVPLDPVGQLSNEQRARAERQLILPGFGDEAQRRLRAAKVLVIGAGGLGSASVPYLVGSGFGTIGIVDDDIVELSNLHRQISHGTGDIGRSKTASLADTARGIDPGVTIIEHALRLTPENARELFAQYDLVIDGSDNFATRYLSNDAAQLTDTPLVWGAILRFHGQVGVAWHRHGPGYRDLFPVPPTEALDCATAGVLPGLCGTVGSLLATEALKLTVGLGEPLIGKVLLYDALTATTRQLEFHRDPAAAPITDLHTAPAYCATDLVNRVDATELADLLARAVPLTILDVRTDDERAQLRLPQSIGIPLDDLEELCASGAPPQLTGPVVVHCAREPRSLAAVRLLADHGVDGASILSGGIHALADVAPGLLTGSHAAARKESLR